MHWAEASILHVQWPCQPFHWSIGISLNRCYCLSARPHNGAGPNSLNIKYLFCAPLGPPWVSLPFHSSLCDTYLRRLPWQFMCDLSKQYELFPRNVQHKTRIGFAETPEIWLTCKLMGVSLGQTACDNDLANSSVLFQFGSLHDSLQEHHQFRMAVTMVKHNIALQPSR